MDVHSLIDVILLAILQGVAEFLPISSSGHLVIFGDLLFGDGQTEQRLDLNIALHVGTLFSILVVYRKDLWQLLFQPREWFPIVIATLPIVAIGLTLKQVLEQAFASPIVAGCGLLMTALLLWLSEWTENKQPSDPSSEESTSQHSLSWKTALLIGAFQAMAITPGISRSGSTIAGGLMLGLSRAKAARFSFLIAIPAIAGACVMEMKDLLLPDETASHVSEGTGISVPVMLIGVLVSFAVGWMTLSWLLKIVVRCKLAYFSLYCALLGGLVITLSVAGIL